MKDIRISLIAFYILAPVFLAARIIQQFFLIDPQTGFYVSEYENIASAISWSFAAVFVILFLLAVFSPKICVAAPKKSTPLGCGAFALAAALFFDSSMALVSSSEGRLSLIVAAAAFISAICFVWYGLSLVTDVKFPQFMTLFPVIWGLVNLIAQFMRYTGQSSIADYNISTVTMCLVLFTLLSHSKLVTGMVSRKETIIMCGIGLATAFFCLIDTLPTYIALVMGKANVLIHDKSIASPTILVMAIYLLIFIHTLRKADPHKAEPADETDESEKADADADMLFSADGETGTADFSTIEAELDKFDTLEDISTDGYSENG